MVTSKSQEDSQMAPAPAFQPESRRAELEESSTWNTHAFTDLSKKIHAQFSKLNNDGPPKNPSRPKKAGKKTGEDRISESRLGTTSTATQKRGKKRDSDGAMKEQGDGEHTSNLATKKGGLEKEVYALGGTAEDFALVANLDSESELEPEHTRQKAKGDTKFEKGLKKGVEEIVKQIESCGDATTGFGTEW